MYSYITRKKGWYTAYFIFTLLASIGGIAYAFVLSELLDRAVDKDTEGLITALVLSVLFMIVAVGSEYVYGIIANRLLCDARKSLKDKLFMAFMRKSIEQADSDNSGEYINELTNNVNMFASMYFNNVIQLPMVVLTFVSAVILCIVIEPAMLIVILIFSLLIAFASNKCGNVLNVSMGAYADGNGRYMSVVKDFFEGMRLIKGYGRTAAVVSHHSNENRLVELLNLKNENNMVMYGRINELLGCVSTLSIMGIAGIFAIKGVFSIGIVLAFGQLAGKIMAPISQASQIYVELKSSKSIKENFLRLLSDDNMAEGKSRKDRENTDKEDAGMEEYREMSFAASIKAEKLGFSYPDGKKVFEGLQFDIRKGGRYLMTGASGAGKSTLLQLMAGMYRNYSGSLCYDDTEVRDIAEDSFHSMVSIVSQSAFMFNDTLKNNVTLFDDTYTDDQVVNALKLSGFDVAKEQLSTIICEDGSNFSGGEKQRINLARAILKNTQVLLLDEFTASLDAQTALAVEKSVLALKDVTIIHVTHHKNEELAECYDGEIRV